MTVRLLQAAYHPFVQRWLVACAAVSGLVLVGCSSTPQPAPPPNAGTLIVRVLHSWGPVHANGRPFGQGWIGGTDVRAKAAKGTAVTLVSDQHGIARFTLSSGEYTVSLSAHYEDDKPIGHGPLSCGVGTTSVQVEVLAHLAVHAQVACQDP